MAEQKAIYRILLLFLLLTITPAIFAQINGRIILNAENISLSRVLDSLRVKTGYEFSYNPEKIHADTLINIHINEDDPEAALSFLRSMGISWSFLGNHIILKPEPLPAETPDRRKTEKFVISGHVTDAETGEVLIGATVADAASGAGTISNGYGFYSLRLDEGDHRLFISYIGYSADTLHVRLTDDLLNNFTLAKRTEEIREVVIVSDEASRTMEGTGEGKQEINVASVRNMPGFLGEPDIIKSLQALPGVNFYSDGSILFHVRGGSSDQNLILVDEAPIYNPAHMLGIFSSFTPGALNSIGVYKGDMPAVYGGRLSSVVDIKLREGNRERVTFSGNTGPVATTLNLEGPLFRKKSSFFVSARRSHLRWLLTGSSPSVDQLYFTDFILKYNIRVNEKNRLFLSGYAGADKFRNHEAQFRSNGLGWTNFASNFRWNHIFGDRLFMNTSLIISDYDYNLYTWYEGNYRWNSGISLLAVKSDFTYYINPGSTFRFGALLGTHFYSPGHYFEGSKGISSLPGMSDRQAAESTWYVDQEQKPVSWLVLRYGIRLTGWTNTGPSTEITLDNEHLPTDTTEYGKGERYHHFLFVDPRLSVRFIVSPDVAIRLAFARTSQFEYRISNSISPFTTLDIWLPSGPGVKPLRSDQFTAGITWKQRKIPVYIDADVFIKGMYNFISYADHAFMLFNPLTEAELRYGIGRAFGLEVLIKKTGGRINGWLSYAFTHTRLRISEVNNNLFFPADYDRPHSLSITGNYRVKSRWTVSANWVFSSGNPFTSPTGYYIYNGYQVPWYAERNNDRLPLYHRLDLATEIRLNKLTAKNEHLLNISFFNIYGHKNPFIINFNKMVNAEGNLVVPLDHSELQSLQPSMMYVFGVIPSVSYHFRF